MFSIDFLNGEATYELNKIIEMESKLDRNDLIYQTVIIRRIKHMIFKCLKVYDNDLSLDDAFERQIRLKGDSDIF